MGGGSQFFCFFIQLTLFIKSIHFLHLACVCKVSVNICTHIEHITTRLAVGARKTRTKSFAAINTWIYLRHLLIKIHTPLPESDIRHKTINILHEKIGSFG